MVKNLLVNAEDAGSIPGLGRSPEEEMATHSSNLARKILWAEESGGLQSMGFAESDTTEHRHTQIYKYNYIYIYI